MKADIIKRVRIATRRPEDPLPVDNTPLAIPKSVKSTLEESSHGGKRTGAGRKIGSGKGRIAVAKTITMHPVSWEKLEKNRGNLSRGKYIETLL